MKCNRHPNSDGPCVNCARLSFNCTPIESSEDGVIPYHLKNIPEQEHTQGSYTLAGTIRKRVPRACSACHSQKARCSAERPSCRRCVSRGFKCEYTPSKRKLLGVMPRSPTSEVFSSHSTGSNDDASKLNDGKLKLPDVVRQSQEQSEPASLEA